MTPLKTLTKNIILCKIRVVPVKGQFTLLDRVTIGGGLKEAGMDSQKAQTSLVLPDLKGLKPPINWSEFREQVLSNLQGKPVDEIVSILHRAVVIPTSGFRDQFERIRFYLHFAEGGARELSSRKAEARRKDQDESSYENVVAIVAYRRLVEHKELLEWFGSLSWSYREWRNKEWDKDVIVFIEEYLETARLLVDFFAQYGNAPQESNHKAIVARFMKQLNWMLRPFILSRDISRKYLAGIRSRVQEIRQKIPGTMVNCCLYETIVRSELYEAMPLLKEKIASEYTYGSIEDKVKKTIHCLESLRLTSNEACETANVIDIIIADPNEIKLASHAWLKLWSMKVLKKSKKRTQHCS